jgi:hypothetical protein
MKRLCLLLVFGPVAFGQSTSSTDQAIAGGVDVMGSITTRVTDLVSTVSPSIMTLGWTMLGVFGVYALLQSLLQGTLRSMAAYHYQPLATVVAYVAILFRVVAATAMLGFYMTPIPGLGINFHQMFPRFGQALEHAITTDIVKSILQHFADIISHPPSIGIFAVLPAFVWVSVLMLVSLSMLGMTIITAGAVVIIGVLTVFGPLMIPFYVLPGHDKRFWSWFDEMFAYSMYGAVGAGVIFIFCGVYQDFFMNTPGYSAGQWLTSLPYFALIVLIFLPIMLMVPSITHKLFGGVGGIVQGMAGGMQALAVRAVLALL